MKEINCNIVKDILPLYVDGVVCDDTREMVDEHLRRCSSCIEEVERMKKELILPVDANMHMEDAKIIKGFHKKWRNKKLLIVILSIAITAVACIGMFTYKIYIPYDKDVLSVTTSADGNIVLHYYGNMYYGSERASIGSMDAKSGKLIRSTLLFYCYDTPWSKYIEPLFSSDKEEEHTFILGNKEKTDNEYMDAVYYGKYDLDMTPSQLIEKKNLKKLEKVWSEPIDKSKK